MVYIFLTLDSNDTPGSTCRLLCLYWHVKSDGRHFVEEVTIESSLIINRRHYQPSPDLEEPGWHPTGNWRNVRSRTAEPLRDPNRQCWERHIPEINMYASKSLGFHHLVSPSYDCGGRKRPSVMPLSGRFVLTQSSLAHRPSTSVGHTELTPTFAR